MKRFDIYYKAKKINNKPLKSDELEYVFSQKYIYKRNSKTGEVEKIDTKDINCVKCTLI